MARVRTASWPVPRDTPKDGAPRCRERSQSGRARRAQARGPWEVQDDTRSAADGRAHGRCGSACLHVWQRVSGCRRVQAVAAQLCATADRALAFLALRPLTAGVMRTCVGVSDPTRLDGAAEGGSIRCGRPLLHRSRDGAAAHLSARRRGREVEDVLRRPIERRGASRVALGQTQAGRYLRVIYVPDPVPDSVFVITAYQLGPKALRALPRRRRRKQ